MRRQNAMLCTRPTSKLSRSWFIVFVVTMCVLASTRAARAEPNDKQALALTKDAIETDYLATDFAKAKAKLEKAAELCKNDGACSAKVRARVHRELGVVLVAGFGNADAGKKEFVEALHADPSIGLDRDLTTKEVEAAFNDARAEVGSSGSAEDDSSSSGAAETAPAPVASAPAPPGELIHQSPAEQAVLTPVPLYVELPEGVFAAKITVHYHAFGADWKTVEMQRRKDGWGVEVPCLDVGSTTGDMSYYIVATDASGDVAGFSGTRTAPHKVPIKQELAGEPPHLPGKPPPAQCQDVSDCPPGFPGCSHAEQEKSSDEGDKSAAKNWISLGIQEDLLFMPSSKTTCGGGEYACFFEDPTIYYGGTPYARSGNQVSGGAQLATTRILAGYDRLIVPNIEVGVRAGFAFGGGPKTPGGNAFLPLHFEVRGTYIFGTNPLERKGFRPYVHLSGGLAQIDGRVLVPIYATAADFAAKRVADLAAWRRTGIGFIGIGGGLMYAITPRSGPFLDVRLLEMLGSSGTAISPLLGYEIGF